MTHDQDWTVLYKAGGIAGLKLGYFEILPSSPRRPIKPIRIIDF
jgi:hypothetical protein